MGLRDRSVGRRVGSDIRQAVETYLSVPWRERVIEPMFESLPDHVILCRLVRKLGFADRMFKNISIDQGEPLIEDVLREINCGPGPSATPARARSGSSCTCGTKNPSTNIFKLKKFI